jgi:hypothetical protein
LAQILGVALGDAGDFLVGREAAERAGDRGHRGWAAAGLALEAARE